MGSPFVSDITHHWNKWCQCWCLCRALSGSWREKMHLKSQHIWHFNSNHDIRIIYGIIGRCKTTLASIEWFKYRFPHVGYFYNPLICGRLLWICVSVIVTACTVWLSGVWSMCKSFTGQCEEQLLALWLCVLTAVCLGHVDLAGRKRYGILHMQMMIWGCVPMEEIISKVSPQQRSSSWDWLAPESCT